MDPCGKTYDMGTVEYRAKNPCEMIKALYRYSAGETSVQNPFVFQSAWSLLSVHTRYFPACDSTDNRSNDMLRDRFR